MMKKHTPTNKKKGGKKKGRVKKSDLRCLTLKEAKRNKDELRLKLVLANLYLLPLDVKNVIHKMSIDTHMEIWKKEHTKNLKPTNDFLKKVDYPAIEGHYDDSWRKRKGLLGYLEYYGENKGDPMNKWSNIKITRPCHYKNIDKPGGYYFKPEKIETYQLDKSQFKPGLEDLISYNEFSGDYGDYWVGKRCRCLHCDVIRLEYRNQNIHSSHNNVSNNLKNKYARITYNPDEEIEKRWATKTKEQAKLDKEMERRKKRNEKKQWEEDIRRYVPLSFTRSVNRNYRFIVSCGVVYEDDY